MSVLVDDEKDTEILRSGGVARRRGTDPFEAVRQAMSEVVESPADPAPVVETLDEAGSCVSASVTVQENCDAEPQDSSDGETGVSIGEPGNSDSAVAVVEECEAFFVQPLDEEATHALRLRVVEALLFAASEPLDVETIEKHLNRGPIGEGADVLALLEELREGYVMRGIELVESSKRFSLRTAPDLADYLRHETVKPVKLSRVGSETLAIIAYHQPITRAEIEAIRGVATSRGTLDSLMQLGWVRPGRRRDTPGRPLTWVTTPAFLDHFGLGSLKDLPGMDELKAAGLLDAPEESVYGVVVPDKADDIPGDSGGESEELPDFIPEKDSFEDCDESGSLPRIKEEVV